MMAGEADDAKRLVVLISGSGSNLQSIIDACETNTIYANVVSVISNKEGVFGLQRAQNHQIPHAVIDHRQFESRDEFDGELLKTIDQYKPDFVVLAGFMRILTPNFTEHYLGKMLNIHPSLLPKYPGLNTHQRAIEAKDKTAGASIHFVTAELDGGPVILQASVDIEGNDTSETLAKKIIKKEHLIYPEALGWLCSGRLKLKGNKAQLDGDTLPVYGVKYTL